MTIKQIPDNDEFLKPDLMLKLYANGAFPMADEKTGEIDWYLPQIRTIIPLNNFNIPRSLKKFLNGFEFRYDHDFLSVVKGCADRNPTWISPKLIEAYLRLHKRGFIHTVETYQAGILVGGLYGVAYKGAFFGESMFSKVSQASKSALLKLIEHLNQKNYYVLDVQYMTEHLKMFGAVEISFDEYSKMLLEAYTRECGF